MVEVIGRVSRHRWVATSPCEANPDVLARCTKEVISAALSGMDGAHVEAVMVNRSGRLFVPESIHGIPAFEHDDLPEYCEVVVRQRIDGGRFARVVTWVPLVWNERFLGTAGGGNRLTVGLMPGDHLRIVTLIDAVQNGFAAASTDGGVGQDPRVADWQFDVENSTNDDALIETWVHRGTHEMTVIGKAVAAAIHGARPKFSYFQGTSGGGRQAIASALYHPADYDGVWSSDPAINWTRFVPAVLWPALVMKQLDNAMAPAKFEAFRRAAVEECVSKSNTAAPYTTSVGSPVFDPNRLVGTSTEVGEITETDAEVMRLIWEGPRAPDGEQLWFGLRPGAESWGTTIPGIGTCVTVDGPDSDRTPEPFNIATSWFRTWILRDPDWDWTSLTFGEYARLFRFGVTQFAHVAVDDPDLSGLRDSGGKLLLTHGSDDQVISSAGSKNYFDRVLVKLGGYAGTNEFIRFFQCHGDGHSSPVPGAVGLDVATGMVALMNWVENGVAPDTLDLEGTDDDGVTVVRRAQAFTYGTDIE